MGNDVGANTDIAVTTASRKAIVHSVRMNFRLYESLP